ncbi:MAG: hypothetical protein Q6373_001475 [Candidatus Sigynarchaeota archaeon]
MGKGGKIAMIVIGAILAGVGVVIMMLYFTNSAALQAALAACEVTYAGNPTLIEQCKNQVNAIAAGVLQVQLIGFIIFLAVGALLLIIGLVKLKKA